MVDMDENIIKTSQAAELTDEQLEQASGGFDRSIFYDLCPSCKEFGVLSQSAFPKSCKLCGYIIERKASVPDSLKDELKDLRR